MAGGVISERLALIIDAKTSGAVTELQKASRSAETLAVSQSKAEVSSMQLVAATDKLAAAEARKQVAEARAAGNTAGQAEAQKVLAAAQDKAAVSKASAAVASNRLSVAELEAKGAAQGLGQETSAVSALLSKFGISGANAGEMLSAALVKVGPLIAAVLAAKVFADGIRGFEELTDQVRKFQGVAGASAQEASLLVGQVKALGIDPDAAAKAYQRMGAAIGDGTSKLGEFGVAVKLNKDGTTDLVGTFDNLRAAYQNSADAATRDAIAKQLSLRAGTALLPLLSASATRISEINAATRARGQVFTQQDENDALSFKVAMNELGDSFRALEIEASKGLIPALTNLAAGLKDVIGWTDMLKVHAGGQTFSVWDGSISLVTKAYRVLTGATSDATAAADKNKVAQEQEAAAADKLLSALTGEVDAEKAVRDAAEAVTDSRQREIDAQAALNKLQVEGAVDEKAVAQAKKDVAAASEQVTKAQESERRAQEGLNKARERASELDLAEARSKSALAGDKIGAARAAEQQAQEKLDALLGSGTATAGQIAAAQAEVKQRHDETTQAILDQQQANKDLQTVQQRGTEQDPAVVQAERTVADAHGNVVDAIGRRSDAEDKLRQAETPDPDYQRKLADAVQGVARAHQAVGDAQDNQVTAALRLSKAGDVLSASLLGNAQALADVVDQINALKAAGLTVDDIESLLPKVVAKGGASGTVGGFPTAPAPAPGQLVDNSGDALFGSLPARASGGPVGAYRDYAVGERGPEILRMGSSTGTIIPNSATPAQRTVHFENHFHGLAGSNLALLSQAVAHEQAWMIRTTLVPAVAGEVV